MKFTKIFLFTILAIFSLGFIYNKAQAATATGSVTVTVTTEPPVCTPIINGRWSSWIPSSCPVDCGQPASTRIRTCTNPAPSCGGTLCHGPFTSNCPATPACPPTAPSAVPTVKDPTSTSISQTTVTLGANVTSLGVPASISARGTCLGTQPNPVTCLPEGGTTLGVFTQPRTGLIPNTTYYYRGYAINTTGTGYSTGGTFTTSVGPNLTAAAPTPSTAGINIAQTYSSTISNIGGTSTGASFSNFFQVASAVNGGGTITDKTSTSMTTLAAGGAKTATVSHTFTVTGTYSIRACADKTSSAGGGVINEGTNEGDNCSSWTNVVVSIATAVPTVKDPTSTSISQTTVTLRANVTSLGIPAVISARGTCWGTTATDPRLSVGSGTNCSPEGGTTLGVFTQPRIGLIPNTTYYYRGYATNSTGTGYSTGQTFVTLSCGPKKTWDGVTLTCKLNNPEIGSFDATTPIFKGRSSTLTWSADPDLSETCTGTAVPIGTGFNTGGLTSGSKKVYPTETTVYTLKCSRGGPSGPSISKTKEVKVIVLDITEQ